jgi:hypothetical protein
MCPVVRRAPGNSLSLLILSLAAAAAFPGCINRGGGTREDELEQVAKLPNKTTVAKFGGHVSVDGQPPHEGSLMFVILNDPEHLVKGGKASATCDAQGDFVFSTYLSGDGAPTGKYVVTFVQLHPQGASGGRSGKGRAGMPSMTKEFVGPDELNNLYSDPDKNKSDPTFQVNVADPGRTNYDFNLSIAGKDPVKTLSEYAPKKMSTGLTIKR